HSVAHRASALRRLPLAISGPASSKTLWPPFSFGGVRATGYLACFGFDARRDPFLWFCGRTLAAPFANHRATPRRRSPFAVVVSSGSGALLPLSRRHRPRPILRDGRSSVRPACHRKIHDAPQAPGERA